MPFFKNRGPSKKRHSGPGGHGKPGGRPGGRPGGKSGKPFGKKKSSKKRRATKKKVVKKPTFPNIESTGMEGLYFKDLIADEQLILLKLTDGKEVRGYV